MIHYDCIPVESGVCIEVCMIMIPDSSSVYTYLFTALSLQQSWRFILLPVWHVMLWCLFMYMCLFALNVWSIVSF